MVEFEDFIKSREVKIQGKNNMLAETLIKSSIKGENHVKKQEIKKLPKILLSPHQAAGYSPQNFLPSATSNFSLSKSAAASCGVLNPDFEINEENAEYIVAEVYDVIRELVEARLSLEGYKSYSHEATVLFLKKFKDFSESEIYFLDNLRKIRNGIKYYGKEADAEEARRTLRFLDIMLPKLKKLIKNA